MGPEVPDCPMVPLDLSAQDHQLVRGIRVLPKDQMGREVLKVLYLRLIRLNLLGQSLQVYQPYLAARSLHLFQANRSGLPVRLHPVDLAGPRVPKSLKDRRGHLVQPALQYRLAPKDHSALLVLETPENRWSRACQKDPLARVTLMVPAVQ